MEHWRFDGLVLDSSKPRACTAMILNSTLAFSHESLTGYTLLDCSQDPCSHSSSAKAASEYNGIRNQSWNKILSLVPGDLIQLFYSSSLAGHDLHCWSRRKWHRSSGHLVGKETQEILQSRKAERFGLALWEAEREGVSPEQLPDTIGLLSDSAIAILHPSGEWQSRKTAYHFIMLTF